MFNIWPECKKKVSLEIMKNNSSKQFHEFLLLLGLRHTVMSNNHRSATVSPSSENSPSTEGGGGGHGHAPHPRSGMGGYAQYSSQDSLPDSPYSSQSLDSQPAPGQGSFCTFFISAIFLHL